MCINHVSSQYFFYFLANLSLGHVTQNSIWGTMKTDFILKDPRKLFICSTFVSMDIVRVSTNKNLHTSGTSPCCNVRIQSIRGYIFTFTLSKNICSRVWTFIHMDLTSTSGVIRVILCSRIISQTDNIRWHAKEVRSQTVVIPRNEG